MKQGLLLAGFFVCGYADVAIARGESVLLHIDQKMAEFRFGEIILAQSATNGAGSGVGQCNSTNIREPSLGIRPEDILIDEFLADPEKFILDPENSEIIADVVREAILRNPSALDSIISAVDGVADVSLVGDVANGINLAAADFALCGDTTIAAQILAKVALAPSTVLRDAVQSSDILVVDEGQLLERLEDALLEGEILEEPTAEAPPLATETGVSSDSDLDAPSSGGTPRSSPTDTTSSPVTTTPPVSSDPASPA